MSVSSAPARRFKAPSGAALAALLLGALAPGPPLAAAGEYLVQDLGQIDLVPLAWAFQSPISVTLGGVAYFHFDDGIHGLELWRSDGTAPGTSMIADTCPGVCGGESFLGRFDLASLGSLVFFSANDGVHGSELWVTDGTAPGTRMVADLRHGPPSSEPSGLHAAFGRLYFLADDGVNGRRLWVSDGTQAGTHLLFAPAVDPLGTSVQSVTSGSDLLYLMVGHTLWRSDATLAGTFEVHPEIGFPSGFGFAGAPRALPNGVFVFQGCADAYGLADCEPWRTDGTVAGTHRLADLYPGATSSSAGGFVPVGAELWFSALVPAVPFDRHELFRTDGTSGGTVAIPLPPGTEGRTPYSNAASFGSRLVFVGCDEATGCEPWITDGTTSWLIADLRPGSGSSLGFTAAFDRPRLVSLGARVLFLGETDALGVRLWSTDGTAAGTVPLSDLEGITPESYFGASPALFRAILTHDSELIFHFRPDLGVRLWRSDGTTPGTFPLATIEDRSLGYVHALNTLVTPGRFPCFATLRQGLVTEAVTATALSTLEARLFFSDGVPAGAVDLGLVDEINGGVGSQCGSNGSEVLATSLLGGESGVLTTSGFAASPLLATSVSSRPAFERFGDRLLLVGGDLAGGSQPTLFSVPRGATVAGDVTQIPVTLAWGALESVGAQVFFGGASGLEVSDALTSSMLLIPPPEPPDSTYQVSDLATAGDSLFFVYDTPDEGPELWSSDGTSSGTRQVRALVPGPVGGFPEPEFRQRFNGPWESRIAALSPGHVVFTGDDGGTGNELWSSDGTSAGTLLVADLEPGPDGSWPRHLTTLGDGVVLFAADDPALGLELYRTDGTQAGTWVVRDIVPGAGSSVPDDFAVEDGVLYFSAWTPAHGRELWRSDGTFAGTYRLTDIAPGALSSSPSRFARAGNRLFFVANDHVHGFELWARADDGSIPLFIDGFETANAARWSAQVP